MNVKNKTKILLRCKLGLHKYKFIKDSKYISRTKYVCNEFYNGPRVYYDKVCLLCNKIKDKAQKEKLLEDKKLKLKKDEELLAKKIWFDGLSDEAKADVFVKWMDKESKIT